MSEWKREGGPRWHAWASFFMICCLIGGGARDVQKNCEPSGKAKGCLAKRTGCDRPGSACLDEPSASEQGAETDECGGPSQDQPGTKGTMGCGAKKIIPALLPMAVKLLTILLIEESLQRWPELIWNPVISRVTHSIGHAHLRRLSASLN